MKVLIFTITAGEGHNVTAAALKEAFSARGAQAEVVNMYEATNRLVHVLSAKGYLFVTRRLNRLHGAVYGMLEKRKANAYTPSLTRFSYKAMAKKAKKLIDDIAPDVILSTHTYASMILDLAKQHYGLTVKTVAVETDFTMHPCSEEGLRADRLVIACEALIPAAKQKGFKGEQILPIGIPIRPRFSDIHPKREAREAFGLDPDLPTLLLAGGSMGHGNIVKLLRQIDASPLPFQVAVVCGGNASAKRKIDNEKWKHTVYNPGFTDRMDLLMDAADLLISKPGGLTTSEALAKKLPLLISDCIHGQETRNTDFLVSHGAAFTPKKGESVANAALSLLASPERLEKARGNAEAIRKPLSTASLCDALFSLCE
ncbi:MAG: glycosyltransferase [Clostridia bacterium]|nr:glycosyltransferase [Clostridia bacterium]